MDTLGTRVEHTQNKVSSLLADVTLSIMVGHADSKESTELDIQKNIVAHTDQSVDSVGYKDSKV